MTLVSKNVYIGDKLDDIVRFFDIVRISKYKNVFAKGYTPNCFEEVFVIKVKKILCLGHMLKMILQEKKLLETLFLQEKKHFMKTNCKKQIIKNLELKK